MGLIGYFWQLPQLILGWIVLKYVKCYSSLTVYQNERRPGCTIYQYHSQKLNIYGVSFGRIIIVGPRAGSITMDHEYGHSRQSRILGPLYLVVVGIPSLFVNVLWRMGIVKYEDYYRWYPERWADRLGGVTGR